MRTKEELKEFLGELKLYRIEEVAQALGLEFPDAFDIYDIYSFSGRIRSNIGSEELKGNHDYNYVIPFKPIKGKTQKSLNAVGYLEFNQAYQGISVIINGISYEWKRFGRHSEDLAIRNKNKNHKNDSIRAYFVSDYRGLTSSTMDVGGKYALPRITSSIDTVSINDDTVKYYVTQPIDYYHALFANLVLSERFSYMLPESLNNTGVLYRLVKVYEGPMNRLIGEMKYIDQSHRFQEETDMATEEYNSAMKEATDEKSRAFTKANELYAARTERAKSQKTIRMQEIKNLQEKYSAQLKLIKGNGEN